MDLIAQLVGATVTLLVVVNPSAGAVYLTTLSRRRSRRELARLSMVACLVAGAVLVGVAMLGRSLIEGLLQIDLASLRVFGGIVLAILGIEYVLRGEGPEEEAGDGGGVTPLALPLIAGPAAITTVIVLAGRSGELIAAGAVAATLIATLAVLQVAVVASKVVRPGFLLALVRLNGFVIGALGVKMATSGLAELFTSLMRG